MEIVTQLIASIGFPIVACIYMFKHMEKREQEHAEEIKSFISVVNNNTMAINELKNEILKLKEVA